MIPATGPRGGFDRRGRYFGADFVRERQQAQLKKQQGAVLRAGIQDPDGQAVRGLLQQKQGGDQVYGGDYWDGGGNSFGWTTISGQGGGWSGYMDPVRRDDTFYADHLLNCQNRPNDYYCKMQAWQKKNPYVVALDARAGGGLRGFQTEQQMLAWMDANPDAYQSWSANGWHFPKGGGAR